MRDPNDLYYFAQVVEHGGFAPASRVLHVPKSKLSRRIALLEEQLDVRLLQRSSRHFSVTDLGEEFYRHCRAIVVEAEAADEAIDLRRAEPQGLVQVSCPEALAHVRVGAILADFMAACPKVSVMLESTNRRVDVIAEGFDVAIRVRPPPLEDSDLVLKVFAERSWQLVASPTLIESLGTPQVPADRHRFPTVDSCPPNNVHAWELDGPKHAHVSIRHAPRLVSDDLIALRTAAMRGIGVAQLPGMLVTDPLKSGELIHLLPGWSPKVGIVHAVFPTRRGLLPSVRTLIDFLAVRLAETDAEQEIFAALK